MVILARNQVTIDTSTANETAASETSTVARDTSTVASNILGLLQFVSENTKRNHVAQEPYVNVDNEKTHKTDPVFHVLRRVMFKEKVVQLNNAVQDWKRHKDHQPQ